MEYEDDLARNIVPQIDRKFDGMDDDSASMVRHLLLFSCLNARHVSAAGIFHDTRGNGAAQQLKQSAGPVS
jgi:hypothetical protein